jgi:hypothetical protein
VPGAKEHRIVPLEQGLTLGMAADAKNLYWIQAGHLNYSTLGMSILDGEDAHTVTGLGLGTFVLALWDGHVYWSNDRGYGRVKTDGSELDRQFMTLPPRHGGSPKDSRSPMEMRTSATAPVVGSAVSR